MKINIQKTKYMIAAGNRTILNAGQTVAFDDRNFEVFKELVYLEALVTSMNNVGLEKQRRIQTANRCFCGLRKHLRSSHLTRQTKLTIYKTLIRPALLYGNETLVLTNRKENRLLVFERKALRTIYGPKIVEGVHRSRYNFEVDREFNSSNVIGVVKSKRYRSPNTASPL
jgi:hypothetical protein